MIDLACVFTTGGVILFYKAFCNLKFDAIDSLVKRFLVQDKASENSSFMEPYMVKWKIANDLNLIFVVVYQEIFHLLYIDDLLEMMKNEFRQSIYPNIVMERNFYKNVPSFEKGFAEVINKWELKQQKNLKKDKIMRSFHETDKGKKMNKPGEEETPQAGKKKKGKEQETKKEESSDEQSPKGDEEDDTTQDTNQGMSIEERKKAAIEKLKGENIFNFCS